MSSELADHWLHRDAKFIPEAETPLGVQFTPGNGTDTAFSIFDPIDGGRGGDRKPPPTPGGASFSHRLAARSRCGG